IIDIDGLIGERRACISFGSRRDLPPVVSRRENTASRKQLRMFLPYAGKLDGYLIVPPVKDRSDFPGERAGKDQWIGVRRNIPFPQRRKSLQKHHVVNVLRQAGQPEYFIPVPADLCE